MVNNDVTKITAHDNDDTILFTESNLEIKNSTKSHNHNIIFSNVYAKWKKDQIMNTLENINLTFKHGSLVVIIGPVGAGKVYVLRKKKKKTKTQNSIKNNIITEFDNTSSFRGINSFEW